MSKTLGYLLAEAAKPKSGTPSVTIKVGGAAGGAAAKGDSKPAKKQTPRKGKSEGAVLRELLQHHDSASIYHRQKAAEHKQFVEWHGKNRKNGHLGVMHAEAQKHHEELRRVYSRLSNATYSAMKTPLNEKKKTEKKTKRK